MNIHTSPLHYKQFENLPDYQKKFIPLKGEYIHTPFRVDPYLQGQQILGKNCMDEFTQRGGKFIHLNPNYSDNIFELHPKDEVYPSCTAGFCRSQTLWALLSPHENLTLFPPHATRYGFDPYNGAINWHKNLETELQEDEFPWHQGKKAMRFGYDHFYDLIGSYEVDSSKLKEIRDYYNRHYFSSTTSFRRVYVTFAQNAHVILYRLNQANDQLDGTVVVSIDLDDYITRPLKEWNTTPRSAVAYQEFALILKKMISFVHIS